MSVRPLSTTALTSDDNIKASAGELFFLIVANSTGNGLYCTINNATSGSGSEIFRVGVMGEDTKYLVFPAGFYFSTGIRVGVLETGLYVTGGYR